MKKIILPAVFAASMPSLADAVTLRTLTPFQRSERTCLSVYYDGAEAYWFNHCAYDVSVRWNDDAKCQNWGCQSEVPANARASAAISRHVRWCECRGTLKTCELPATGC